MRNIDINRERAFSYSLWVLFLSSRAFSSSDVPFIEALRGVTEHVVGFMTRGGFRRG
jgi:hypothetical protein